MHLVWSNLCFPNDHAVYLHDTPADYFFEESERDFSHGCIRIEDPRAFAELLLQGSLATDQMNEIFHASQRQVVDMPQAIPVYIVYFTTWVDENGAVNFRDDVYDHDDRLWQALKPVLSETVTNPKTRGQWIFGLTPDPEVHSQSQHHPCGHREMSCGQRSLRLRLVASLRDDFPSCSTHRRRSENSSCLSPIN